MVALAALQCLTMDVNGMPHFALAQIKNVDYIAFCEIGIKKTGGIRG